MEIKFGPSSLITIESSGYARPFDRTPVEEHTCRHPRRDVEGLVTASHLLVDMLQVRLADQARYHHALTVSSLGNDCQAYIAPPAWKLVNK